MSNRPKRNKKRDRENYEVWLHPTKGWRHRAKYSHADGRHKDTERVIQMMASYPMHSAGYLNANALWGWSRNG